MVKEFSGNAEEGMRDEPKTTGAGLRAKRRVVERTAKSHMATFEVKVV